VFLLLSKVRNFDRVSFRGCKNGKFKKKQNGNLGVNRKGKNIRRNYFQRTIDFGNNIITSGRHHYSQPKVHYINNKDDFKSFVQHITGKKNSTGEPPAQFTRLQRIRPPPLSIGRPPVPA